MDSLNDISINFPIWGALHENQQAQMERIWNLIPGDRRARRAWFCVLDAESDTRFGRVVMGDGERVLEEAAVEFGHLVDA